MKSFDKKVIFIDTRAGGDWALDLLFSGLVNVLGPGRVIDSPWQEKHRALKPVLTGDPETDWGAERRSFSYTPRNVMLPVYSPVQIRQMLAKGEVGLVIVDERAESWEQYCALGLNKLFNIPTIVVSGHDKFWNISPTWVYESYYKERLLCMFLDNWRDEYASLPFSVAHYNLSTNFDHLWDPSRRNELNADKKYDICFMGNNSHPVRMVAIKHVLERWKHLTNWIVLEDRPDKYDAFVPKRPYFETMAQSRICLNVRGAAEDGRALRFFEIPYVGSYMLSQTWPGMDHQIHPITCDYFSTLDELDARIQWALDNPVEREVKAAHGHIDALLENSSTRRAREMIEYCVDLLGRKNG